MKKIEAVIRPHTLDGIVMALEDNACISGLTVYEVRGFGMKHGRSRLSRILENDPEYIAMLWIIVVVGDELAEDVVNIILSKAWTGQAGDGLIIVSDIEELISIRTVRKYREMSNCG